MASRGTTWKAPNLLAVETDVGKSVAVAAERIFEDRIEGDARAAAFEHVAGVEDTRDGQG
jgi:hypothetical protein